MKEQEIVQRVIKAINKNPHDITNSVTSAGLSKRIGLCRDHLIAAEVVLQDLDTFIKTRYPDVPAYIGTADWFTDDRALLAQVNKNLDILDDNFSGYFGE